MSELKITGVIAPTLKISGTVGKAQSVIEKDYDKLINKPSINDIELVGNKTFEELGITDLVQNKLEVSNIIAGANITLGVSGNNVIINSTGGGGGTGIDGKSAYEIAVENGFIGNELEWIESLKGESGDKGNNGIDGKSAYEVWLNEGNIGSELDFLNSLKGENGIDGINGIDGNNGTSITSALVNNDGDLIVTLDTGVSLNTGHVKGADGTSINIKGDLLSPDDLPPSNQELGDCYIILGHLWVYVDSMDISAVNGFKDVGNIKGVDGKSAYEVAISSGFIGTESEWLLSLKGDKGNKGEQGVDGINGLNGADGKDGTNGINGLDGANGIDGIDGKSAYEIAVENGFVGTEIEWIESLDGTDGINGINGADGKSAYQIWLDKGNTGTELEFLASLKGLQGDKGEDGLNGTNGIDGIDGLDGKSAYIIALEDGFIGTKSEWLASLKGADGAKGDKGDTGEDGYTPIKGTDYLTPADIDSLGINPTITTDLTPTTQTVTLSDNTEYRYGTLTSLAITWTTSDIRCSMAFTGGTGVTFSITSGVKIVGTDVASNVFTPVVGKRYNLGFEFDGVNRTVYVSGVI